MQSEKLLRWQGAISGAGRAAPLVFSITSTRQNPHSHPLHVHVSANGTALLCLPLPTAHSPLPPARYSLVAAEAEVGGDGIQRRRVLHALLPDVQAAQEQAEGVDLRHGA